MDGDQNYVLKVSDIPRMGLRGVDSHAWSNSAKSSDFVETAEEGSCPLQGAATQS